MEDKPGADHERLKGRRIVFANRAKNTTRGTMKSGAKSQGDCQKAVRSSWDARPVSRQLRRQINGSTHSLSGHDENKDNVLRAIEFARMKGGKPFIVDLPGFGALPREIGQTKGTTVAVKH